MTRVLSARARAVLVAAAAAVTIAAIGGTMTEIGPWYHSLVTPAWKPPDLAFGPIWTVIFALAAAAGVMAWRRAPSRSFREWMIGLFAMNGFLNVLWTLLFFRLKRPDWALTEVVALWISIAILIGFLWRVTRTGALLLTPYLLWVSIAAALNFEVDRLNGPFGAS